MDEVSFSKFFEEEAEPAWGSKVEVERRNRIRLAVAAYAYEFRNTSIMSDGEFDELAKQIDPTISTGHTVLDRFFATQFQPDTGQWVYKHPELGKLVNLYQKHYATA
jgi:hypothetical protein